jgi:predicted nucleic acid-binding protein
VIFIDTCSLLDVIRGREEFRADHGRAVVEIIELGEACQLAIVLPQQVINEYTAHLEAILTGGGRAVDAASSRVLELAAIMQAYGAPAHHYRPLAGTDFIKAGKAVLDRIVAIATIPRTTIDILSGAYTRSMSGRAPSAQGKNALGDCVVIETCLDILTRVRGLGNCHPAHFLSANKNDYGEPTLDKRSLHLQLVPEFDCLNLAYSVNFLELRYRASLQALQLTSR